VDMTLGLVLDHDRGTSPRWITFFRTSLSLSKPSTLPLVSPLQNGPHRPHRMGPCRKATTTDLRVRSLPLRSSQIIPLSSLLRPSSRASRATSPVCQQVSSPEKAVPPEKKRLPSDVKYDDRSSFEKKADLTFAISLDDPDVQSLHKRLDNAWPHIDKSHLVDAYTGTLLVHSASEVEASDGDLNEGPVRPC